MAQDPLSISYHGQEGSGLAQILPDKGPDATSVIKWKLNNAIENQKYAQRRQAQDIADINGLFAGIKQDGWYKHKDSLQSMYSDGRKQIVDMFSRHGESAFDRSTATGRANYLRAQEIVQTINRANTDSKQIKGYYDATYNDLSNNPQKYTPESIELFKEFYDMPFHEQIKKELPTLQTKPEFNDYFKYVDQMPVGWKETKMDTVTGNLIKSKSGKVVDEDGLKDNIKSWLNSNNYFAQSAIEANAASMDQDHQYDGITDPNERLAKAKDIALENLFNYKKNQLQTKEGTTLKAIPGFSAGNQAKISDIINRKYLLDGSVHGDPNVLNSLKGAPAGKGYRFNSIEKDVEHQKINLNVTDENGEPFKTYSIDASGEDQGWTELNNIYNTLLGTDITTEMLMRPGTEFTSKYKTVNFDKATFDSDADAILHALDNDTSKKKSNAILNSLNKDNVRRIVYETPSAFTPWKSNKLQFEVKDASGVFQPQEIDLEAPDASDKIRDLLKNHSGNKYGGTSVKQDNNYSFLPKWNEEQAPSQKKEEPKKPTSSEEVKYIAPNGHSYTIEKLKTAGWTEDQIKQLKKYK